MGKITRIAYNSSDWRKPTGEARKVEAKGTYNKKMGFGQEDWLFRSEWLIDGWRYAFLEGVRRSHAKLVKEGKPVDLTLFTIEPNKRRRYVATVKAVECLSDQQAEEAVEHFKRRGWYDTMLEEIAAVHGDPAALSDAEWARHLLNVRFRLENVTFFHPEEYATADDPILKLTRYMLYDEVRIGHSDNPNVLARREGSTTLPISKSFLRRAVDKIEYSPEHIRMQAKLMKELTTEYPNGNILREQDFIDVRVQTETELLMFEIKSDLEPRTVIRQALGQILEYAYHAIHPNHEQALRLRLVIVGRRALSAEDGNYLHRLRTDFRLPVEYRVVSL